MAVPPPPRGFRREYSTQERTYDTRYSIRRSEDAGECCSLGWRHGKGDDCVSPRTNAGSTHAYTMSASRTRFAFRERTSDGAANDQCDAVWRHGADQTTQLENGNGDQEGGLQGEVLVAFAPSGLEGADGKEEGGPVPSHLVQAVELVGDLGDGGCDDCHVECHKEDGEDQSNDDHGKLVRLWVICCFYPCKILGGVVVVSMGRNLFGLIVRDGVVVVATGLRRNVYGLFFGRLEMRCGRVGCSSCSVY